METMTGDQNVSHSGFDQNSFLVVRGRASVPFNARQIPFLAIGKSVADLVFFACVAGRPPVLAVGLFSTFGRKVGFG